MVSLVLIGDPVTPNGAHVEALTLFYGLRQLTKTPTRLLPNSTTFIDLVFNNQPHLVMESGGHSSPCSTNHHQMVFAKLIIKFKYPPSMKVYPWAIPDLARLQ